MQNDTQADEPKPSERPSRPSFQRNLGSRNLIQTDEATQATKSVDEIVSESPKRRFKLVNLL